MPPTFFGCLPRQKIDQKRHLSSRLSRIHFCDLIHGGGLVFGLHAIVASPAERDQSRDDASRGRKHFNPRVPCGTRRRRWTDCRAGKKFLPTRPLRDATRSTPAGREMKGVSTHASLAGRDYEDWNWACVITVSTHASLAGRDNDALYAAARADVSTHASLAGRDDKWLA